MNILLCELNAGHPNQPTTATTTGHYGKFYVFYMHIGLNVHRCKVTLFGRVLKHYIRVILHLCYATPHAIYAEPYNLRVPVTNNGMDNGHH